MLLASLDAVGGQSYFMRQAEENPNAYMSLIGKIIPAEVLAIGNKLTEDIQVGDKIWWDVSKIKDGYQGNHVIHQDWVEMVERN